ncbi:extracellular solute-binding protein [Aeromonas caviae]|uniref:extracellular solute-binding protein n=1 Tax=Aeromonas caviae TaxID=648 RepID=UPI0025B722A9|nr:extracellular solute-binding protein [Aeromonas caviae]
MREQGMRAVGWFMPAEWCRHAATWMVWPHNKALWENGWGVTLPQVQQDFARVVNAIARFEPVNLVVDPAAQAEARALCGDGVRFIPLPVDDSWCRDSGPTFICHPELGTAGISWRFNAWGGKSAHGLDEGLARRVLNSLELECIGSFLANEGGAIHVDGEGTLITTESVLLNSNRNPGMTKVEIERIFSRLLGIEKTIWLPGDPDHVTGDMTQARRAAAEAGKRVDFEYRLPKEGSTIWMDTMAIPADAPHPDYAYAFINFVMRPANMAAITNSTGYPTASAKARPMVDATMTANPDIYLDEASYQRLIPGQDIAQSQMRARMRAWTRFKSSL